jgi:nucleotidyltransferase/DNA polymerase involved in DNA repair
MARTLHAERDSLVRLKNVGKAALADFKLLGIFTVGELATKDADTLYIQYAR